MQHFTYVVSMSPSYYHGKRPYQLCLLVNTQFRMCTSLVPRLMTIVFGMGTRLPMHMRARLENGVQRNRQQPCSAVNSFTNQGKFEATKRGVELRAVISINFVPIIKALKEVSTPSLYVYGNVLKILKSYLCITTPHGNECTH